MQGCGSDTIFVDPPNNEERHPAGFVTSIHEKGQSLIPSPIPGSFAIFHSSDVIFLQKSSKNPQRSALTAGSVNYH